MASILAFIKNYKVPIVIVCVSLLVLLLARITEQRSSVPAKGPTDACTVTRYRNVSEPVMTEFGKRIKQVDLHDPEDVQDAILSLKTLLTRVNALPCKDEYPLKHESLEYAIRHMIDAFQYRLDGDLVAMSQSIAKSELNVRQFKDWTVDLGK